MVPTLELLGALLRRSLAPDRPVELGGAVVDWTALVRLATGHLVAPMITDEALSHLPAGDERDAVAGLFGDIRRVNAQRNDGVRRQIEAISLALGAHGIRPVLLKGAARLVDGLYPTPAMRHLRDIDLLIEAGQLRDAARILGGLGYRHGPSADNWPAEHHHLPILMPSGGGLPVELHAGLLHARHDRTLPVGPALAAARPVRVGSAWAALLAPADALVHVVGHEQLNHQSHLLGHLGLRSAVETMLLIDRDPALAADLMARAEHGGHRRAFTSMLLLGSWLMDRPCPVPAGWFSRAMLRRAIWQQDRPWAMTLGGTFGKLLMTVDRLRHMPEHRRKVPRRLLQRAKYANYLLHLRDTCGPFRMR